ncbi:tetratricopeptide repeat protein [Actinoplanes sp. NBRC 103695]|uniref:AfsR/SARP family transcriptional regulator n=1 Tax=Actinoplanes sp. NBRC 103695 TaxID=3032202 RepID=UPI0025528F52|nr:tetratricopeptide repeat protein [Actinoplanes sp. NBRC 103695]
MTASERALEFRILGPVEIRSAGRSAPAGEPRQRALLAALLLEAGRAVTLDVLIDRVWGDSAPRQARRSIYAYVARLRRALEQANPIDQDGRADQPLLRTPGGYVLDVDPEQVDVLWFRVQAARGRDPGLPTEARAAFLRQALDLWHGDPLTGVGGPWADRMRDSLRQERADAVVAWAQAEIAFGRTAAVLVPLAELAAERPLAEPVTVALIRALHVAGRLSEALDRYDRIRRLLRDELGIDPGPELQAAHRAVLRQEPPIEAPSGPTPTLVTPAQLPADVTAFTGRSAELADLDRWAPTAGAGPPTLVCVTGTAGAGKTAIAVHWGHRARDRFPDGQLYIDLRGYDPEQPIAAVEALGTLLAAVLPPGRVPAAGLDERAAQYRTELAGRRMLILLDNASTVEQVRPLLPGTAGCMVVVTSRDALSGLVVVNGAHRIALELLTAAEAAALLRQLIGGRVDREPGAAATLADQCVRLPLAIRIAAELAVGRPRSSLSTLTAELAEQQRRLELLSDSEDPRAAVDAVFSWSIRQLRPEAARAFALLGRHPGPHFDIFALAALTGCALDEARRTLTALRRAHLIFPVTDDRYGLHDLLRAYAARLAGAGGPDGLDRLLDHYLGTASSAMQMLYPGEADRRPMITEPASPQPALADATAAQGWLASELDNLTATCAQGRPEYAIRLAAVLYRYLDGDHHRAALAIHECARQAAHRLGDQPAEAYALNALAHASAQAGHHALAVQHLEEARRISERTGDELGQARALGNIAVIDEEMGRYQLAASRYEQAMHRYRQLGDLTGEAHALTRLSSTEARLGRDRASREHADRALTLHRQAGHRFGEAWALNSLGEIEARAGHHHRAADQHRQALALFCELGHRSSQAWTLDSLGVSETQLGRHGQAVEHHERALALFRELGDRLGQASSLNGLGEAFAATGQAPHAIRAHTRALTIATGTGARGQQARAHAGLASAGALGHRDLAAEIYSELGLTDHLARFRRPGTAPEPVLVPVQQGRTEDASS